MSTLPAVTGTLASAAAEPRPLRVLLVEDSEDDALLLDRHLRKAGFLPLLFRVETAERMLAALDQPWDCILADYNLPLFSAPEALMLLQSTAHDIPFIMMSGAVSEATAVAAMRAGAHDYVSKQNLTRLAPAIERELAEAASRRLKRATERALRTSEERFHHLVEATPLALLISDMMGRVTYCNGGVERLLGFSQADLEHDIILLARIFLIDAAALDAAAPAAAEPAAPEPAAPDTDAAGGVRIPAQPFERATVVEAHPLEPSQHAARLLHTRAGERGSQTWEMLCTHRDGSPLPVLVGAAVLNPEAAHKDLQLAVFLVDLSAQKRGEEVLRRTEKLAAAGRLAASIAHEINNPLEAITNCLYLLEQSPLDEEQRAYLAMAQAELDRVSHITTQTLRFYRQSTRPMATEIPDLLDSVLALYEARIRDHGIAVLRDYDHVPPILALDGEIRQVLANLIGNAVDAMASSPGPRTLMLRARPRRMPSGDPGVALIVADRGTGMSAATLTRIYEPFFSTKGITGTGLGLWVSQEIMRKHNGLIQVRTRQAGSVPVAAEPGATRPATATERPSGTVFRLLFPLESQQSDQPYEAGLPTLL